MTHRSIRMTAVVGGVLTLGSGATLAGSSSGGISIPLLIASAAAIAAGCLAMLYLAERSTSVSWGIVWLACFAWFEVLIHVAGDSMILAALYSGLFATMGTLFLMALVYLGPWNASHHLDGP